LRLSASVAVLVHSLRDFYASRESQTDFRGLAQREFREEPRRSLTLPSSKLCQRRERELSL
jgi:hypothetical protein